MTSTERKRVLDQFVVSEAQLVQLVEGLTPEQLAFRPSPESWSIAEVVEHVLAVESRLVRAIGKMAPQPSARTERPDPAAKDEALWKDVPNRATKLTAPEPVRPTGKFTISVEITTHFKSQRQDTIRFVEEVDADLRGHVIPHIAFGDIDLYQWLIVLSQHGSRHAQQIEEIKAAPAFPR